MIYHISDVRQMVDCGVDSLRVPVVFVRWKAPPLVCTFFRRSSDPTDMRGELTRQPIFCACTSANNLGEKSRT